MDYLINVYYEEEYICTLAAKYLKMYTEQIWWQLDKLIKAYRDKIITKELLLNTVEKCTDNFKVLPIDSPLNEIDNVIDFKKEVLTKSMK